MRILDRFIGRTVVVGTLMALLILLAIDAFFAFVGEIDSIGRGSYTLGAALAYIVLTLPRRAYELFPMAALLGSLMGLGGLAAHSELMAVRAAGVSVGRIIYAVLRAGLVLALAAAAMGEWVAPVTEQYAQSARAMDLSQRITFKGSYGFWARDGDRFINIQQILPGGRLGGIYVYEFGAGHRLKSATEAQHAIYRDGQWVLEDIRQSVFSDAGVQVRQLPQLAWNSLLSPDLLNVVVVKPENLSARDLYRYIRYLEDNGLDADRYRVAMWLRILAPLTSLVMLFLSVPFVFGSLRTVGAGQRLLVGVLVGVGYFLLNQTVSHLGQVYNLNPLASALAAPLVFLVAGAVALRRVN